MCKVQKEESKEYVSLAPLSYDLVEGLYVSCTEISVLQNYGQVEFVKMLKLWLYYTGEVDLHAELLK
jgi:hypothetical protein